MNLYFEVLGEINKMSEILDYKRSQCPVDLQEVGLLPCKRDKWPVVCEIKRP
jgi:hypothetical protein